MNDEILRLRLAYLALLATPTPTRHRPELAPALCVLRDAIAASTGADAEAVQNDHEWLAAFMAGAIPSQPAERPTDP